MPFDLGRPLGAPNDAAFQTRVVVAALKLLEKQEAPIIEDYPDDVPEGSPELEGWACPVDLSGEEAELTGTEKLVADFKSEFTKLGTWYDQSLKNRGRTTANTSGVNIDDLPDFISAFLSGDLPDNPREDVPLSFTLKLAAEDLKAYYFESVTAQPGETPGAETLADWFWGDTIAGATLLTIKNKCASSDDGLMQIVGNMLIVPGNQMHRKAEG